MLYNFIMKLLFLFGHKQVHKKTCDVCGEEIYLYHSEEQFYGLDNGKVKCGKCDRTLEPVRAERKK